MPDDTPLVEGPDTSARDLNNARSLAAAALPALVTRLTELAMADEDAEFVRKSAETVLKIAQPDKNDAGSKQQVVHIVFQANGLVEAKAVEPLPLVEEVVEVTPAPAASRPTPAASEIDDILSLANNALL